MKRIVVTGFLTLLIILMISPIVIQLNMYKDIPGVVTSKDGGLYTKPGSSKLRFSGIVSVHPDNNDKYGDFDFNMTYTEYNNVQVGDHLVFEDVDTKGILKSKSFYQESWFLILSIILGYGGGFIIIFANIFEFLS